MKLEISSCFCGKKPIVHTKVANGNSFKIRCNRCNVETSYFSTEEDAVEQWNFKMIEKKEIYNLAEILLGDNIYDVTAHLSDIVEGIENNPDRGINRTHLESEWIPYSGSLYEDDSDRGYTHYCSICKGHGFVDYLFCPGCGAEIVRR